MMDYVRLLANTYGKDPSRPPPGGIIRDLAADNKRLRSIAYVQQQELERLRRLLDELLRPSGV